MQLNIESVERSKSGKSYSVKANGKTYTCKAPGIEQMGGKVIEATLGSFQYNGRDIDTIESFTVVAGAVASPSGPDRWWLPFVSNQTAHLIQVGEIKDAASLSKWVRTLKLAVVALDTLGSDDIAF